MKKLDGYQKNIKNKFYIPKRKSELIKFLNQHTRCKITYLKNKTLDELIKHYYAVRINWR